MPVPKTKINPDQRPYQRKLRPLDRKNLPFSTYQNKNYIDLSHNDYLGLSQDQELIELAKKALQDYGNGSGGSRLLGGDHPVFHDLESLIASTYQKQAALFFNNGYQGNLAVFKGLFGPDDIVFADKYVHASCLDACLLAGVQLKRFAHQNMQHLEKRLKQYRKKGLKALIVSEALFSMQGDFSPLNDLIALKEAYDCQLMVDEAHSLGVYGPNGLGCSAHYLRDIEFIFGTFGKALGSSGAFVTCSLTEKQTLLQKSRPFIYSTALPHPVMAWNRAVFIKLKELSYLREKLIKNAHHLRIKAETLGFHHLGESHIIPLRFSSTEACIKARDLCLKKGFFTHAIFPPTVPEGQCQLRLSLNSTLHDDHFDRLKQLLIDLKEVDS